MKTHQIKINPANRAAITEIKNEFSPVLNKIGYEIIEEKATSIKEMEMWLTDNDFFIGGLTDEQIEFYYNKLK